MATVHKAGKMRVDFLEDVEPINPIFANHIQMTATPEEFYLSFYQRRDFEIDTSGEVASVPAERLAVFVITLEHAERLAAAIQTSLKDSNEKVEALGKEKRES